MSMTFGLIGTGHWADVAHAAGLAAAPDVVFDGVWGRDPDKTRTLAARYGIRAYNELDDMFANVDAVSIAVPPAVQSTLATRAALAGKHLLLDKPIALSTADADELLDAVTRTGVASVVFVTNRFVPEIEDVLTTAVAVGGWNHGRCTMLASILQPDSPYAASVWRKEKGGLWDLGPHALSLLLPVLGPVVEVSAVRHPHETTEATLRHDSGATSVMSLSVHMPVEETAADTTFDSPQGTLTLPRPSFDRVAALATAAQELIGASTLDGRPHRCDARFGWDITAILAAAQESAQTGARVPVPVRRAV